MTGDKQIQIAEDLLSYWIQRTRTCFRTGYYKSGKLMQQQSPICTSWRMMLTSEQMILFHYLYVCIAKMCATGLSNSLLVRFVFFLWWVIMIWITVKWFLIKQTILMNCVFVFWFIFLLTNRCKFTNQLSACMHKI